MTPSEYLKAINKEEQHFACAAVKCKRLSLKDESIEWIAKTLSIKLRMFEPFDPLQIARYCIDAYLFNLTEEELISLVIQISKKQEEYSSNRYK